MIDIRTHATGAPIPDDEGARLYNLRQFDILDTLPEQVYDDIVRLASHICKTPMAIVSFVDQERQWMKAQIGMPSSETPRDVSFCAHAILGSELFIVQDASADSRFRENPLVTGAPGIRFYAGAPLVSSEGLALGSLCVIDSTPRTLSEEQQEALRALGRMTVAQLEQRRDTSDLISAIAERDNAQDQVAALQARIDALEGRNTLREAVSNPVQGVRALASANYPVFLAGLTAGALLGTIMQGETPDAKGSITRQDP